MAAARMPAAQRRTQLMDVAMRVFSREGYHGATMADVADAAGVTKPVLYQHFPSKRDLYLALLDQQIAFVGFLLAPGDPYR